jgi:GAF domain-containing protein
MVEDPDGLENAVRILSRLLLAEETLEATLGRVASLACRTLPDCELASVTMIRDGRPSTAVQTAPDVSTLDTAQYAAGSGPCLEAYQTRQVVRADLSQTDDRWPAFNRAAATVDVVSVLAVPLIVTDTPVGAVNLYSKTSRGFSEADEETALLFSEQAAVACANSEVYWRTYSLTEHLREALESRDAIGQAKGILMAQRKCTSDEAFEALRKVSQRRNVKLREIADHVIYTGGLLDDDSF